jgi:hypothetical protein
MMSRYLATVWPLIPAPLQAAPRLASDPDCVRASSICQMRWSVSAGIRERKEGTFRSKWVWMKAERHSKLQTSVSARKLSERPPRTQRDWLALGENLPGPEESDGGQLNPVASTPKNVQFECDAHCHSKGTYVRQDIPHKTNGTEEKNPRSASALYVPLLLSAR